MQAKATGKTTRRGPDRVGCGDPDRPADGSSGAVLSVEVLEVVRMRLRVICEPTRVQIMALLDQHGPMSLQDLADRLPSTYQNVARHLQTLHEAGMVARTRTGNHVRYELTDWSALWLVKQIASTLAQHINARPHGPTEKR